MLLLSWAHLHAAAAKQCTSVAAMHCGCSWAWFYTFDRPDLDAIPSGLLGRGRGAASALYCVLAEHRTRPWAKCDWNQ